MGAGTRRSTPHVSEGVTLLDNRGSGFHIEVIEMDPAIEATALVGPRPVILVSEAVAGTVRERGAVTWGVEMILTRPPNFYAKPA